MPQTPKLSLIHAGTIYPGIAGEFFDALQHMLDTDPSVAGTLRVDLLGEIAEDYVGVVHRLESAGLVRTHGLQPHAKTLTMVKSSDVLLILMGGTKYLPSHLPSKFYEYLHAGKPILAIAREGELTDMARESGLGIVVPPQSVDLLVQTLCELLAAHANGGLPNAPNRAYIRSFERSALARSLADVLDDVVEGGGVGHGG